MPDIGSSRRTSNGSLLSLHLQLLAMFNLKGGTPHMWRECAKRNNLLASWPIGQVETVFETV